MGRLNDMRTIKLLLEGAEVEARSMGEEEPGAEHLLLAALQLPDGDAERLLGAHGIDHDRLRSQILAEHRRALVAIGMDADQVAELSAAEPLKPSRRPGLFRSSASAQEAFRMTAELAQRDRRSLSSAHVVEAVAAMEHGTAARVLGALGVDRAALADAARAAIG